MFAPVAAAVPVTPARLLNSYWLDGSAGLDISGLSFCGGELLAASDKDSDNLYAVQIDNGNARLQARALLAGLAAPPAQAEDLTARLLNLVQPGLAADIEGITCDADNVYLVSERYHRIAAAAEGVTPAWLPQQWAQAARERGYMQQFNGASEGLVRVGDDFWVALERDRRGLVHFTAGREPQFFEIPAVAGLHFQHRSPDLTGLAFYDGDLFTLERNAFAVCRRSPQTLAAKWCITYRAIEEAPDNVYLETYYGKGEGLAVNDSGIYVVLDNNNVARAANPQDRRGLLLHLAFPPQG
ncbi:esterase-like activity of phytase family protein [Microbulbifer sp. SAOS-129_SWC]|uniref:esterase-like activity of phytase family protein n=1 Tax=Microbulbifer sp. SAOS-129_SWC TaxID=3145235 RepID=UPI003217C3CA